MIRKGRKSAAIIGGGIAGCSASYSLSKLGLDITLFEKNDSIAKEASGNKAGILHPRIDSSWNEITDFYYRAFSYVVKLLKDEKCRKYSNFSQVGSITYPKGEKEVLKFKKISDSDTLGYAKLISSEDASLISGISISDPCLYIKDSGYLSVPGLCKYFIEESEAKVFLSTPIDAIKHDGSKWALYSGSSIIGKFDILVIANSYSAKNLLPSFDISLSVIRGQITYIPKRYIKEKINTVICHGGYIIPEHDANYIIGSTFDRDSFDTNIKEESHIKNLNLLKEKIPNIIEENIPISTLGGKVGLRCYTKDKIPIIGALKEYHNLFLSIAHGSRGILSAPISGEIIASKIMQESL